MLSFNSSSRVAGDPTTRTTQPIVTGTSVLAVKYDKGVMMVADTLASYGTLARYKDVRRIVKIGDRTIIGASGNLKLFNNHRLN
jgi:20S proteasome subunit beta 7